MLNVEQAWEKILAAVEPAPPRAIPLFDALDCVLAEEIQSRDDSPPFDKSMMDGYAVRAGDFLTHRVADTIRLVMAGEVFAGTVSSQSVTSGTALRIMTGAPIPGGADAVIPVEWTTLSDDGQSVEITLRKNIQPQTNILRRGSLMQAGETILHAGTRLRAQELALLAETGHPRPLVRTPPVVAILATGDELVEVDQIPGPGQIRNSNGLMLAAQVRQAGAIPRVLGIARDDRRHLNESIQQGLQADFLCLSGGVSAGEADFVPAELQRAGVQQIFHKIAMKPGKPVWFGTRPSSSQQPAVTVFGLPGNPVSSMVCFELFVRTALRKFLGELPAGPPLLSARLDEPVQHRSDRETWLPAEVRMRDAQLRVRPVHWKGSADLRSTVNANCSLSLPAGEIHWEKETAVTILPWGRGVMVERTSRSSPAENMSN